jgi:hypothetical protein
VFWGFCPVAATAGAAGRLGDLRCTPSFFVQRPEGRDLAICLLYLCPGAGYSASMRLPTNAVKAEVDPIDWTGIELS